MNTTGTIFFLFFFFFPSSYLVFLNSKVVESTNKVQEFKLFTDLVNRCLVTVPTRYPIPFSTADYWTNYEFHNKVKMCLWTILVKQRGWWPVKQVPLICLFKYSTSIWTLRARKRRKYLNISSVLNRRVSGSELFKWKSCNAKRNLMSW